MLIESSDYIDLKKWLLGEIFNNDDISIIIKITLLNKQFDCHHMCVLFRHMHEGTLIQKSAVQSLILDRFVKTNLISYSSNFLLIKAWFTCIIIFIFIPLYLKICLSNITFHIFEIHFL